MISTRRLTLIPHSEQLLNAEINDHAELGRLLSAFVPENWPPESTVDALPFFLDCVISAPDQVGWLGWYAIANHPTGAGQAELIGGGGFMGPPQTGSVQIGYSVIDQHQGSGYATELVEAMLRWAFSHSECTQVVAETEWANPPSVRVLEKNGFIQTGAATTAGGFRFERKSSFDG